MINQIKFKTDVPNEFWLKHQIEYAKECGPNRFGVPYMGKITTNLVPYFAYIPVSILAVIPGMRNEQNNVRPKDLASLIAYMAATKELPPMQNSRETYKPFIQIAHNGEAWVNEGNHRIMAAKSLGWDYLPVEIRYYDGGERENGILSPLKVQEYHSKYFENLVLHKKAKKTTSKATSKEMSP